MKNSSLIPLAARTIITQLENILAAILATTLLLPFPASTWVPKNSIPGILSVAAITGMSSPTKTAASKSAILVAPAWNMATNLSRYGIFREYLLNAHRLRVYKSA